MNYLQLQTYTKRINNVLSRFIDSYPTQSELLVQAMRHGVLLGGKRIRPMLVYATGNMLGVNNSFLDIPAAAVECVHAYSLVHDDLPDMDDNDLRRGLPSCHIKFGKYNAILAGNALQTLAFTILSNDTLMENVTDRDRLAMIFELATAIGITGMCNGQALDLEAEKKNITLNELECIHRYKTGALIRASVRIGALSAGRDQVKRVLPMLDRFSENIGLAFQIQDDILDVTGSTIRLGKRQGADQKHNKNTYPAILGLSRAQSKVKNLINSALDSLKFLSAQSFDTSILEIITNYIIQRDK